MVSDIDFYILRIAKPVRGFYPPALDRYYVVVITSLASNDKSQNNTYQTSLVPQVDTVESCCPHQLFLTAIEAILYYGGLG